MKSLPHTSGPTAFLDGEPHRADRYDAVVVGGGIIGCSVALYLREAFGSVLLLEREGDLLLRASYNNQARVHNGYHYPRSLLTGLRSRVNFPRFVAEFADCIDSSFEKYYAVAKNFSKVTGDQFATFCRRIGAPVSPAPPEIRSLFDRHLIDEVFSVREYAFDAGRLRGLLRHRLEETGVEVRHHAVALNVERGAPGRLRVGYEQAGAERVADTARVFNCTYSSLNALLRRSGLPLIPLKHELTEIALVRVPAPLAHVGLTVMCGPFFSVMPFPARSLHSFTHVRYTPHESWEDRAGAAVIDASSIRLDPPPSSFSRMLRDAQRYVPVLADTEYRESLWETKTVLPSSEMDDSRPILFRVDHGLPGLTSILGGKIDNIYDVIAELDAARVDGRIR